MTLPFSASLLVIYTVSPTLDRYKKTGQSFARPASQDTSLTSAYVFRLYKEREEAAAAMGTGTSRSGTRSNEGASTSQREEGASTSQRQDGASTSQRQEGAGTSQREEGASTSQRQGASAQPARSHDELNNQLDTIANSLHGKEKGKLDPVRVLMDDGETDLHP
jgi:hypothetical protein